MRPVTGIAKSSLLPTHHSSAGLSPVVAPSWTALSACHLVSSCSLCALTLGSTQLISFSYMFMGWMRPVSLAYVSMTLSLFYSPLQAPPYLFNIYTQRHIM